MSETVDPKNIIKTRDLLYRLMISQLFYDGHQSLAVGLSAVAQADPPCPPSDRLLHVVMAGLRHEPERSKGGGAAAAIAAGVAPENVLGPGLDLEFETDVQSSAPEPALYETAYVTSHKGNCRAGAFSADGQLIATGSVDASIKILDVDRMLAKSAPDVAGGDTGPGGDRGGGGSASDSQGHPVIRTLYDHLEEVTCLEFHPREPILASGSRDFTVKLFDYSKTSVKKAFRTITDAEQVRCLSFHPTGDYILVGTNHPVVRLYDVHTSQCFVCSVPSHQHTGSGVTSIRYSPDGKIYTSAGRDGSIKVWDGVSNRCVNTFMKAHDGAEVCSVCFTRNGKYILSSGKDSLIKLWELSTSRCLIAYTGAGTTGKQEHRAQAVFNHTEDYVLFPDEATTSLCAWNSRNASRKQLLSLGHNGPVRLIAHSPTAPAFLTCSDDFRARFWFRRMH
ncbi:cleavage stimulation factor subunit 1 [Schistocerca americana]|uniref:cleavage stimulation factor subunit 1 n=1 Tax=Schistocerca americana TaxID=7009 RepID=UPI001F4F75F9|nr:cleavage stimulation factor subunit 1 [Schistocerca americana]XP_047117649.1 cleavage stimulation factor subunit 1 [Schistocerca piceifrons]